MTVRHVSLPDAVIVAAAAAAVPPSEMLDAADMTLLVLITGRSRSTSTVAAAAAELLVGVAAGRPFAAGNRPAAWSLAAYVATLNRHRLELDPDAAVALLDDVATGVVEESRARAILSDAITPLPTWSERVARWLFDVPPGAQPVDWRCPACDRTVTETPFRSSAVLADPLPLDVIRDCAARHRAHGPEGHDFSAATAPLVRTATLRRA